jgi:Ser/Thr protein kinase RdoA (MazF antagonist)
MTAPGAYLAASGPGEAVALAPLQAAIVAAFPERAGSTFLMLAEGWDSVAIEVDGRLIFKFPRHEAGAGRLVAEADLLAVVRPAVTLPVPGATLHPGPPLFSWYPKIPGEHLLPQQFRRLPAGAKERLALDLARFHAEQHDLPADVVQAAGAGPIWAWPEPEAVLHRVWPMLPAALRGFAAQTIADWQALGPDPCGQTFGYFDGHGWNMAFDHRRQRLNGIYDFGSAGFGPLHRDFIYSGVTAAELTALIVDAYEARTNRSLDRRRIEVLCGVLRLVELAEQSDDAVQAPKMLHFLTEWADPATR